MVVIRVVKVGGKEECMQYKENWCVLFDVLFKLLFVFCLLFEFYMIFMHIFVQPILLPLLHSENLQLIFKGDCDPIRYFR
jgi:hypothetical protein